MIEIADGAEPGFEEARSRRAVENLDAGNARRGGEEGRRLGEFGLDVGVLHLAHLHRHFARQAAGPVVDGAIDQDERADRQAGEVAHHRHGNGQAS